MDIVKDFLITTSRLPIETAPHLDTRRISTLSGETAFLLAYEIDNDIASPNEPPSSTVLCGRPWPLDPKSITSPSFNKSSIENWSKGVNGGWCLLQIGTDRVRIVTDPLGALPVYCSRNQNGLSISTREDWCLISLKQDPDLDLVSLTEMCQGFGVTFPNCLFSTVQQIEPGTIAHFDSNTELRIERWFDPATKAERTSARKTIERVQESFDRVIDESTSRPTPAGILMSGGADSRAIAGQLHILQRADRIQGFHLQAPESHEQKLASAIAEAYGINLLTVPNSGDNYSTRLESGLFHGASPLFVHSHFCALSDIAYKATNCRAPIMLGGLLGDMLKAHEYSKRTNQFISRWKGDRISRSPISYQLRRSASERRLLHNRLVKGRYGARNPRRWAKYWPLTHLSAHGNYLTSRHLFHQVEPFMSQDIFWPLLSLPERFRHGRLLSELAFRHLYARSKDIPTPKGYILGDGPGSYIKSSIRPRAFEPEPGGREEIRSNSQKKSFHSWPARTSLLRDAASTIASDLIHEISDSFFTDNEGFKVLNRLPMRALSALLQAQQVRKQVLQGIITSGIPRS